MVATIKVGKIAAATGTTVNVESGHTLKMSGMPVQIQVKNITTKELINNTASIAGVDTIMVSDAFTPKFSDSKILVCMHPMIGGSNLNGGLGIKRTVGGVDTFIGKNSTGSFSSGSTAPNTYMTADESPIVWSSNGDYAVGTAIDMYVLDTHGTTSPITYTMTFHSGASNETLSINQPRLNTSQGFGQSVIILQEWVT